MATYSQFEALVRCTLRSEFATPKRFWAPGDYSVKYMVILPSIGVTTKRKILSETGTKKSGITQVKNKLD